MFGVIAKNLKPAGRFVGVTTNGHDPWVREDKKDFYGIDIDVLEQKYVAPDTELDVSTLTLPRIGNTAAILTLETSSTGTRIGWTNMRAGWYQGPRYGAIRASLLFRCIPVQERGIRTLRKGRWDANRMETANST